MLRLKRVGSVTDIISVAIREAVGRLYLVVEYGDRPAETISLHDEPVILCNEYEEVKLSAVDLA